MDERIQGIIFFIGLVIALGRMGGQRPPPPPPPNGDDFTGGVSGGIRHLNAPNAHYDFEEPVGSGSLVVDTSGNGNDGQTTGTLARVDTEGRGRGLSFNGVNSGVIVPHSSLLNLSGSGASFTIFAVVTFRGFAEWPRIVQKGRRETGNQATSSVAYRFGCTNGSGFDGSPPFPAFELKIKSRDVQYRVFSQSAPLPNTTYFLAGVRDGATLKLYINGVLDNTATCPPTGMASTSESLNIGTSPDNTDGRLDGILEDLQIYNRVLTDLEIEQLSMDLATQGMEWQQVPFRQDTIVDAIAYEPGPVVRLPQPTRVDHVLRAIQGERRWFSR